MMSEREPRFNLPPDSGAESKQPPDAVESSINPEKISPTEEVEPIPERVESEESHKSITETPLELKENDASVTEEQPVVATTPEVPTEKLQSYADQAKELEYVQRHYPQSSKGVTSDLLYSALRNIGKLYTYGKKVEGQENIPSEAFLIVASHEGRETGPIAAAFKQQLHFLVGKTTNLEFRPALARLVLPRLKFIFTKESLSNFPAEERQAVVDSAPARQKGAYEKIKKQEEAPAMQGPEFVRQAVACLLKNEPVVVYPQGLFKWGSKGRPASGGYSLIATEYERVTGKKLPIVPVETIEGNVFIRAPFYLKPYDPSAGQRRNAFYGQEAMDHIHGNK